jgi:hypothetical protein
MLAEKIKMRVGYDKKEGALNGGINDLGRMARG